MSKVADLLFCIAIAIGFAMLMVCMLLLPEHQPPDWVGWVVLVAMGVCLGAACAIGFSQSVRE